MSRYFPSDDRRGLVALLSAALVIIGLMLAPLAQADDLKDKQREVKKQKTQAHHDLDESSTELRQATINLRRAQKKLDTAQAKLGETRGELSASKARDVAAQVALDQAKADLQAAREELKKGERRVEWKAEKVADRVAMTYEKGDPRLASVNALLSSQNPGDLTRSLAATDAILDKENAVLTELEAAKILLGVKETKVEEKKEKVAAKRKAAADNLKLMRRLEAKAAKEEAAVASLVSDRSTVAAAAQKVRDRDKAVLATVEREDARIQGMLRKRAAEARRKALASRAAKAPRTSGGYLSYPVNGRVTSPYGYRVHPIYGYTSLHDGVDFGAGCGQPLYASANGVVVEKYFQSAWGNRLIIDHGYQRGRGLATIYNHATRYTVSVGSRVTRGQLIGYVGTTGWSTGCHLHFTVMANGAPTNPMNWL
ncbi:MAG TPA: peptidoglycan DD-metalloendopeptidase family protein [Nocardioides sp.]